MWLVSNMSNHKLDPDLSKEEFKKFANATGLLICIEDIKNYRKLKEILAWNYDENMTYRNKEVNKINSYLVPSDLCAYLAGKLQVQGRVYGNG